MLVDTRSGKSGCSFEVLLDQPVESEFVMVTNDGQLVSPRAMPKRLQVCVYPSLLPPPRCFPIVHPPLNTPPAKPKSHTSVVGESVFVHDPLSPIVDRVLS